MLMEYPVELTEDENGAVIAEFPDVPEARTIGADKENALVWARDALTLALSHYMEERRDIPVPSAPERDQPVIALPPLEATKIAIYQAMREQHVTQARLAEMLNCDARQVRRLLDLHHASRMDQLDAALQALGLRMVVDVRQAA